MKVCQDAWKHAKTWIFLMIFDFFGGLQAASRKFLGSIYCVTECPRHHGIDCRSALRENRYKEKLRVFGKLSFSQKMFRIAQIVLHGGFATSNRCWRCWFIIERGHARTGDKDLRYFPI